MEIRYQYRANIAPGYRDPGKNAHVVRLGLAARLALCKECWESISFELVGAPPVYCSPLASLYHIDSV